MASKNIFMTFAERERNEEKRTELMKTDYKHSSLIEKSM